MRIKAIALAMSTTGCISAPAGIYLRADREPIHVVRGYLTPLDKELKDITKGTDPLDIDPRKVFGLYCSNGKARRKINTKIRAISPKPPKGLVIDKAAEAKEAIYRGFREVAKSFYSISSYVDATRVNRDEGHRPFYALTNASMNEFVKDAKESRLSNQAVVTLLTVHGQSTLYLATAPIPTFITSDYSGSQAGMFQIKATTAKAVNHHTIDAIFPKRVFRDVDGNALYPMYPVIPFETEFFPRYFTMLIPESTQEQLFGRRTYFLKNDGAFNLSDAIGERDKLWAAFINAQTSLKESQTDDPQIIDFEIELNLDLFCSYGRMISDLVTD
jgi:hypothetical protein